ncbi:MAG: LamG domain-containing protein, partial [Anaerohalosphaera sp.]|nr:LamG domain-containing protein [Anaerohalosphaera sp.]
TASNSDTVDIPAAAFATVSNAVSISMWINGNIADPPLNNSVLYGADASGQRVLNIHLPWSNSGVYWDAGNSGTSSYDRINKTAEASEFSGQWNYWVFTKDATSGEMKIYLNGVLWHSGTGKTLTMSTITSASIGSKLGTKYFYDGLIDDVRVYNYALTAEQVNDLFVCGGSSILETLLVIANRWLDTNCGEFDWCDGADINKDTVVDWFDYASIDCINISR